MNASYDRFGTAASAALVFAFVGTAGSLYLSLGMGLRGCPLCFYQRAFVMSVLSVLFLGLLADRARGSVYCLLSLPSGFAGLGVAVFHESLVLREILECPLGILGLGTAPVQSLVIYILLCAALVLGALGQPRESGRGLALFFAVVFGLGLASASIASAPPLPPLPTAPYDPAKAPLDICRPPFRAAG